MELEGQINDIIYQNEINGYTIATYIMEDSEITVVGYLPFIHSGDFLKINGNFVTHKDYGEQFKIETFEKLVPKDLGAIERYLSNGTIKGIGPATAKKIVEKFGEETIHVLKLEPEKLSTIKGITKEKAMEMSESFNENWDLWQIVGFLEKFGIGVSSAKTIYKELGSDAINEIESNPYLLIDLVRGVEFRQIDKMALDLGISYDNRKRIESGIKYSLIKASTNGHCCVLKLNLLGFVNELIGVSEDYIDDSIIDLKAKEEIVIEQREKEDTIEEWIYLTSFYRAEENIATKLIVLDNSKNIKHITFFEEELKKIEKVTTIKLSTKQKEAIKMINNHNVTVITGGPGTGKTTIIKSIIELYKVHGMKVELCAPTGRAAKRITETTMQEAKTLHRLLEIGKLEEEGKIANIDYDISPIDADVIVVDEMSMVDLFLMNYLVNGIYQGTKLVLVGDVDQLPSVGPGNILKDIIGSEKITTIHLNKIFRQAAQSKIITNAHKVNEGEPFIKKTEKEYEKTKEDFFYINEKSQEKILYHVLSLSKDRLKAYGDYEFFQNIQILTPTKKGMLGTKELNQVLQQELNPSIDESEEKVSGNTIFRNGDRVMQIKNNYDIHWEKNDEKYEYGSGIFNGELGRIEKIDHTEKYIQIKFDDDKIAWYAFSELDQIEHAYAITIHKAQGSEFDVVIMLVPQTSPILLTRNLLYTGITRAKKLLIVIGADNVLEYMIRNIDSKKRNSGLDFKLISLS